MTSVTGTAVSNVVLGTVGTGGAGKSSLTDELILRMLHDLKTIRIAIISADHGCDPTWPGTDHTREYVPILAFGPGLEPAPLGRRESFADIGQNEILALEGQHHRLPQERGPHQDLLEAVDFLRTETLLEGDLAAPGFLPGTGVPEIGGISPRDAQVILRSLQGRELIGADICEVSPLHDPTGMTCITVVACVTSIG